MSACSGWPTCVQIWTPPKSTQVHASRRKAMQVHASGCPNETQVQNLRRLASPLGQGLRVLFRTDCCWWLTLRLPEWQLSSEPGEESSLRCHLVFSSSGCIAKILRALPWMKNELLSTHKHTFLSLQLSLAKSHIYLKNPSFCFS